jgi:putative transcriptional regulator
MDFKNCLKSLQILKILIDCVAKSNYNETYLVVEWTFMREWLAAVRKMKSMTQLDVAAHAGISRAYYAQIERNLRLPSIRVAKAIAGYLDFDWVLFFCEDAVNMPAGIE